MSLLTTAQLTFCDLKDSYSVYLDTDCIGLACDNSGLVLESQTITINYRGLMGTTRIGLSCEVDNSLDNVTVSTTSATNGQDGTITLQIEQGATLGNEQAASIKVIFITESDDFTFEKYITFVKYMVGASGADAVTFKVYSSQGFIFKEDMSEIELKIAAFRGDTAITDATYTWEWWDITLNNGVGEYVPIVENTTDKSLIIYKGDKYALANLRCIMSYDGNEYEEYVSLSNETVIYSSVVKFFNGSNIFDSSSPYLVAYIDLYRNNDLVDSILTNQYYYADSVSDGAITTNLSGNFEDGDLVYFIYYDGNRYQITLGEYQSGSWQTYDYIGQYIYINDLYQGTVANVVVISKNDVAKSKNINFTVYKNVKDNDGNYIYNDETYVTTTNTIVVDINDPIISATEPQNVNYGQLWLDTSSVPYILKVYTQIDGEDAGEWQYFAQQNGGVVYTSKPNNYSEGDLWILAEGETCDEFSYGTMLRAIRSSDVFNESDWVDAMDIASTITNIKETFTWDSTGIKIAKRVTDSNGTVTTPFYVHIDSTRMGFHSVDANGDYEVVHIGNNAAVIKNATFVDNNADPTEYSKYEDTDGARFDCNATFDKQINICKVDESTDTPLITFVWQVEDNNSLSLTIV